MPELTLHLPPLRTFGTVVLIDDDDGFLQTLAELLASDDYCVAKFTDPTALHAFMDARRACASGDRANLTAIWRAQFDLAGTVALDALRYFAAPTRFQMPLALVSDFAMPRETGLSVCARHGGSGVRRVLLTGVADTNLAVSAFNSGSIEQYVQKQGSSFPGSIVEGLRSQVTVAATARGAGLADQLHASLTAVLTDAEAGKALQALLTRLKVREYMMLGEPQGIVGVTREGTALWIQLETESSLEDLEDILDVAELDGAVLERVRRRETLVAVEWMQQIGQPQQEQPALVVSSAPLLLAAVYPLRLPPDLRPAVPAKNL